MRLRRSVEAGVAKLRKDEEGREAIRDGIAVKHQIYRDSREAPPQFDINIRFPRLRGPGGLGLDEVNLQIEALVQNEAQLCRSVICSRARKIGEELIMPSCSIDGESQVTLATSKIISVMFDFVASRRPAAHGTKWRTSCNLSLRPIAALGLDDIFDQDSNYRHELAQMVLQQMHGFGNEPRIETLGCPTLGVFEAKSYIGALFVTPFQGLHQAMGFTS